jgi:hypothetical protein
MQLGRGLVRAWPAGNPPGRAAPDWASVDARRAGTGSGADDGRIHRRKGPDRECDVPGRGPGRRPAAPDQPQDAQSGYSRTRTAQLPARAFGTPHSCSGRRCPAGCPTKVQSGFVERLATSNKPAPVWRFYLCQTGPSPGYRPKCSPLRPSPDRLSAPRRPACVSARRHECRSGHCAWGIRSDGP